MLWVTMLSMHENSPVSLSYEPPQPGSSALRQAIVWIVILGCVSLFVWESQAVSRWAKVSSSKPPLQLTLQGRYLFGLHQAFQKAGSALPPAQGTQAIAALDESLKQPVDKLRLVPVVAELQGASAARERITLLRKSLSTSEANQDADTLERIYQDGISRVSAADREALIARLGWFGNLAVSWQEPGASPLRASVVNAALRTLVSAVLLVLLIILAFVVGFVLLIVAIVQFAGGKIRPKYVPSANVSPRYLEAFALYLLAMIGVSLVGRYFRWHGLSPSFLLLLIPPAVLAWPAMRDGARRTARTVGWTGGIRVLREMGLGITGYLAGLPIVAVGFGLSLFIAHQVHAEPSHPVEQFAAGAPIVIVQLFLLASVLAPLVEETMFRGALYGFLRGRCGWILSATIVGLIFAAIHPQGWTTIPALGSIGFVLATIREWRNSLVASMTAHALNNAFVCTFLVIATSMV